MLLLSAHRPILRDHPRLPGAARAADPQAPELNVLSGAGFLTVPVRADSERIKWSIASGVFGLAAAYAAKQDTEEDQV